MTRNKLIQFLAEKILGIQKDSPVLIGIDGVDTSGKTTFADELAEYIKDSDINIIRASIDGFHNPEKVRHKKGKDSPEGYYYDSFNYEEIAKVLLEPLSSGKLEYKTAIFDYCTDSEVILPMSKTTNDSILIMYGIFLFRPELIKYWDLKIFLDIDFKITIKRAIKRSTERNYIGSDKEIIEKYNNRYIPGQKLYFKEANPKEKADIIIDNSDFEKPIIRFFT